MEKSHEQREFFGQAAGWGVGGNNPAHKQKTQKVFLYKYEGYSEFKTEEL
jgi:hypothetical protein